MCMQHACTTSAGPRGVCRRGGVSALRTPADVPLLAVGLGGRRLRAGGGDHHAPGRQVRVVLYAAAIVHPVRGPIRARVVVAGLAVAVVNRLLCAAHKACNPAVSTAAVSARGLTRPPGMKNRVHGQKGRGCIPPGTCINGGVEPRPHAGVPRRCHLPIVAEEGLVLAGHGVHITPAHRATGGVDLMIS